MRALSDNFLHDLIPEEGGKYGELVKRVRRDKDLDLEFRGNYINIYYQGHNILLLRQNGGIKISEVFTRNIADSMPVSLNTPGDVDKYLKLLPSIKDNVVYREEGKSSSKHRELEFEQLLIRANNRESTNNSEYIIIDRQYVVNHGKDRWDLVALRYPSKGKPKGYLSIIEVKYAQNKDIQDIKSQIERYVRYLKDNLKSICLDMCRVLEQKLILGLITRTPERIDWFKELCRSQNIDQHIQSTEIMIYLIDHNPNSTLINNIEMPEFQGCGRIAFGGLAMWQQSSEPLGQFIERQRTKNLKR